MNRRNPALCIVVALLALWAGGCSKSAPVEVVIELPGNFGGQVHVEMGVPGAPPLKQDGPRYVISVPPDGKVSTSTMVPAANPTFNNAAPGRVWGYTPTTSRTGDGVPVGGTIEFFIGTREQYESAEAKKKNKSHLEVAHSLNTERS